MLAKALLLLALLIPLFTLGCGLGAPTVAGNPQVVVTTSLGQFTLELEESSAPIAVANFKKHVDSGFYDGTIFHRVVPGFAIQGGAYLPDLTAKPAGDPIVSEANNGLKNLRGTVGMYHDAANRDSATSQFYINLADNAALDASLDSPGYTVFAKVISGMDVVDRIGAVQTQTRGSFDSIPVDDVTIQSTVWQAGPPTLSPAWQTYFTQMQYNAEVSLRNFFVNMAGWTLSRY